MGEVEVYHDASILARAAAERFVSIASKSIEERGRCIVALAGGSTPQETYRLLTTKKFTSKIDWQKMIVFLTDERSSNTSDPASTFQSVWGTLLSQVPVRPDHVHVIVAEADPVAAASTYDAELRQVLGHGGQFDLVLLSLYDDGSTAALLPDHPAVSEQHRYTVEVLDPGKDIGYVTLTLPVINKARNVMFLAQGAPQSAVVDRIKNGESFPASLVTPSDGTLIWMLNPNPQGT